MADPFFGLELMHVAHKEALQRPADAAVLFVHWTLASSGLQAEHPTQVSASCPDHKPCWEHAGQLKFALPTLGDDWDAGCCLQ